MIINEEGTYTLRYTATDSCGKTTEVERELVVADNSPRRTVLYTDGTFIINEKQTDEARNTALHGAATNVYDPMLEDGSNYVFSTISDIPWRSVQQSVTSVQIGSEIHPSSVYLWFDGFVNCKTLYLRNLNTERITNFGNLFSSCIIAETIDVSNFNTGNATSMASMFYGCAALETVDLSNFDTRNVYNFTSMFENCSSMETIDISSFSSQSISQSITMFSGCTNLETIFATSLFDTSGITESLTRNMFNNDEKLVGGSGTDFASTRKWGTYGRIDNPPDAPGYFTAKS